MLKKSPLDQQLGCLFFLVGGLVGFLLGGWIEKRNAVRYLAAHPGEFNDAPPVFLFMGMIAGALVGAVLGMVIGLVLMRKKSAGSPPAKAKPSQDDDLG